MSRTGVQSLLLLAALSVAACNQAPAREALAAAETALEESRPGLGRYAPADLSALDRAVAEARTAIEEGRYTDALRIAQDLPSRTRAAILTAEARRGALVATWDELSGPLPGLLERLRRRIGRLGGAVSTAPTAPAALVPEAAWVVRARRDMARLDRDWAAARAAHDRGDLPGAVAAAGEVGSGARDLAARLGLDSPPAGPTPPPASAAPPDSRVDEG